MPLVVGVITTLFISDYVFLIFNHGIIHVYVHAKEIIKKDISSLILVA